MNSIFRGEVSPLKLVTTVSYSMGRVKQSKLACRVSVEILKDSFSAWNGIITQVNCFLQL